MNGKEYFAHVKHLWDTLKPEERAAYSEAAKAIRDDPYKGQPRDRVVSSQLKIINQAVSKTKKNYPLGTDNFSSTMF